MKLHIGKAAIAATILALPLLAAAQDDADSTAAKRNFMKTLAGKGGRVVFDTGLHPDGRRSFVRMTQDEATGQAVFLAAGKLKLDSEQLYLECEDLAYSAAEGTLKAEGGTVVVRAEGMNADCTSLLYNLESGEVTLDGTGQVSQQTDENDVFFDGMRRFLVTQAEGGGKNVRLEGPDEIAVSIRSKGEAAAAGSGEGLSALGSDVRIETKAYGSQPPAVGASLSAANELQSFRAKGSVRLASDSFTILAEEFVYDATAGIFQATGKVYMENKDVKAECGKMVYETATGKITLSILPFVEKFEEGGDGKTVFSGYDVLTYTMREGQTPDVNGEGGGQVLYQSITPATAPANGGTATPPAREILVNP